MTDRSTQSSTVERGVLALAVGLVAAVIGGLLGSFVGWYAGWIPWVSGGLLASLWWRSLRAEGWSVDRTDVVVVVAVVLLAIVNVTYAFEHVFTGRDGGTYVATAEWLVDNHSVWISPEADVFTGLDAASYESAGFYEAPGSTLLPQFLHALPVLMGMVGNAQRMVNAVIGAIGLLAVYAFGRRIVRPHLAGFAVAALGLSLPFVYFSRGSFSEPLTMTFTFAALAAWVRACRSERTVDSLVAGALAAAPLLARIDGLVLLIPLGAFVASQRMRGAAWPQTRPFVRGFVVIAAVALIDLGVFSAPYLGGQFEEVRLILLGVVVTPLFVLAVGRLPGVRRWLESRRGLVSWVVLGTALLAIVFGLLARPSCCEGRFEYSPVLAQTQVEVGVPVDGTRSYSELSVRWLTWYLGAPATILGLVGLAAMWSAQIRRGVPPDQVAFVAISAIYGITYLARPSITPDQIWAMRRFLPVVIPSVLLGAAWMFDQLRPRVSKAVDRAGVVTFGVVVLIGAVLPTFPWIGFREWEGASVQLDELCVTLQGNPVVVVDAPGNPASIFLAQPIRGRCRVPVAILAGGLTPGFDRWLSDLLEPVWVISGSADLIAAAPGSPSVIAPIRVSEMERTLFEPPREVVTRPFDVYGVRIEPAS